MKRTAAEEETNEPKKSKSDLVIKQLWSHQRSAIHWMAQRELPSTRGELSGGILGDAMGLGKTASILGLVFWKYVREPQLQTLVVVPASLLHKWRDEWFKHFTAAPDSVFIYHGANKHTELVWDPEQLRWSFPKSATLVLTTYGQVLADHRAMLTNADPFDGCQHEEAYRCGVLAATDWYRIVLDESHSIQNEKAKRYDALCRLSSLRRWAVTGTVYSNRWNDIAAVCAWIGVKPYNNPDWWRLHWIEAGPVRTWRYGDRTKFLPEATQQGFIKEDFNRAETLPYILIRPKSLIPSLPPLQVKHLKLDFTPLQLEAYRVLAAEFKIAIHRFLSSKKKTRSTINHSTDLNQAAVASAGPVNTAHLFRIIAKYLVRLRQFCNHPLLAREGAKGTEKFRVCIQCSSTTNLKLFQCGHQLCSECRQPCALDSLQCTTCSVESQDAADSVPFSQPKDDRSLYGPIGHSTKFQAILICLEQWKSRVSQDGPLKVVIFSQWVSTFNLLEPVLGINGYKSIRFTGETTNLDERDKILKRFEREEDIKILLCGLKVGGVGLDLVIANKAILVEPWFNLPVEEQAQDRLHRMGQVRPVQIVKLSMAWSLEDWLYDLQEKKSAESKWLIGEWNGQKKNSNSHYTAKELSSLSHYLCPSYFLNHRPLSKR